MFFTKLKLLVAAGIVALAATGAGVAVTRSATADDPPAAKVDKPAEKPATKLDPPAAPKAKPTIEEREKAAQEEYAPLAGTWSLEAVFVNGAAVDAESSPHPVSLMLGGGSRLVQGANFIFRTNTFSDGPVIRTDSVNYVVNRRRTPHELTVVTGRQSSEAKRVIAYIYEVAGEKLKLAYYDDPFCTDRPHGFAPKDQPAGSPPLVVLDYKLVKRPDPPQPRAPRPNPLGSPGTGGVIRRPGGGEPKKP